MPLFWRKKTDSDLENMTVDQLIEWKLARKRQIDVLKEELHRVQPLYNRKVEEWHAREALKRVGLEGIVLEPEPGHMKAEGK